MAPRPAPPWQTTAWLIHEYRIRYPVGVDMPSAAGQPIPRTMLA